jgi:hypothetical protein
VRHACCRGDDNTPARQRPRNGDDGRGVVTCSPARLDWVRANLGNFDRDTLFPRLTLARIAVFVAAEGQELTGPDLKYVCSRDTVRSASSPEEITVELLRGDQIVQVYAHPGFDHPLGYQLQSQRPDMLATLAWSADEVVGIAGASAYTELMWQVGAERLRWRACVAPTRNTNQAAGIDRTGSAPVRVSP